jgi:hypothetical protein
VSYDEFYKTDPKLEAEFQTPTIFDRDFNFHCSIFYRAPKIVKIIIYILYICKSVSTHFNLSNFNLWVTWCSGPLLCMACTSQLWLLFQF